MTARSIAGRPPAGAKGPRRLSLLALLCALTAACSTGEAGPDTEPRRDPAADSSGRDPPAAPGQENGPGEYARRPETPPPRGG